MAHTHLAERSRVLLLKHRRELKKINKSTRLSDELKDEARTKLADEIAQERDKLQADIEAAQAEQRASTQVKPGKSIDDASLVNRWERIEAELNERRHELHGAIKDIADEAGKAGDEATLIALRNELPGYVRRITGKGMSKDQQATLVTGLQAYADQSAGRNTNRASTSASKNGARLTMLLHGLTQGIKEPDRYVVLPDFKEQSITIPGLSAISAKDKDED